MNRKNILGKKKIIYKNKIISSCNIKMHEF